MEIILASSVIAAIVAGVFSYVVSRRQNKLQYITAERKKWREELRDVASEIQQTRNDKIENVLVKLKVRLNSFGRSRKNRFDKDTHIWQLIDEIETKKNPGPIYKARKRLMIEYIALLLKADWERAKAEVIGDWHRFISFVVMIISCGVYGYAIFSIKTLQEIMAVKDICILVGLLMGLNIIVYVVIFSFVNDVIESILVTFCRKQNSKNLLPIFACNIGLLFIIVIYMIFTMMIVHRMFLIVGFANRTNSEYALYMITLFVLNLLSVTLCYMSKCSYTNRMYNYYYEILECKNRAIIEIGEYLHSSDTYRKMDIEEICLEIFSDRINEEEKIRIHNAVRGEAIVRKRRKNIWDKTNITLCVLACIFTIGFIALLIASIVAKTEKDNYSFLIGLCGIVASLASAVFIAVAMRIIDMSKLEKLSEKAQKTLMPYFTEIYTTMDHILPEIMAFAEIKEDDTICYPSEKIYYKDINCNIENRTFIELEQEFRDIKKELDIKLGKCLDSPLLLQCDNEIIELLTRIKINGFAFCLYEASSMKMLGGSVYGIYEKYIEFIDLYTKLGAVVNKYNNRKLVLLDEEEKEKYIQEINCIIPQLPPHNGTIYRGAVRIK